MVSSFRQHASRPIGHFGTVDDHRKSILNAIRGRHHGVDEVMKTVL